MNHAERERKVRDLERRLGKLEKLGALAPMELLEVEGLIEELENVIL